MIYIILSGIRSNIIVSPINIYGIIPQWRRWPFVNPKFKTSHCIFRTQQFVGKIYSVFRVLRHHSTRQSQTKRQNINSLFIFLCVLLLIRFYLFTQINRVSATKIFHPFKANFNTKTGNKKTIFHIFVLALVTIYNCTI